MRGVGFVILFLARRWVCCRLLLRVRAVLGLREVGVLGLEREGIVGCIFNADCTGVRLFAGEVAVEYCGSNARIWKLFFGELVDCLAEEVV